MKGFFVKMQFIVHGLIIFFYLTTTHAASYLVDKSDTLPVLYNVMTFDELRSKERYTEETRKASMVCDAATKWINEYDSAVIGVVENARSYVFNLEWVKFPVACDAKLKQTFV